MKDASTNKSEARDVLIEDMRRYLELGLGPLFKKLNFKDDETTERLFNSLIAANMISVDQYTAGEKAAIEKAYGGCHNCYGKGYATVNDRWTGYDTDQDIGSPGGVVSGGNPNAMKFCTCDRGKQLEALAPHKEQT